jgi:hypothetical protein
MIKTYRGWEIDRGQPSGIWGYAPDYDGADPKQTQSGSTVEELCEQIDCVIEEYPWLSRDDPMPYQAGDGAYRSANPRAGFEKR